VRRVTLIALTLAVLAAGIAAVAVADHRHKDARIGPASVASWYCEHRGQRCNEPQAPALQAAWHRREHVYRASFWTASFGALTALAVSLRQRVINRKRADFTANAPARHPLS